MFALWFLVVALAGGAAHAREPAMLQATPVTSRRIPEDIVDVPAAIGVVDVVDVQLGRQQLALDEALSRIPGVYAQNRTNFAQDLRVSIRGFGARANFGIRGVKVFVDGIPATLPDGQTGVDDIDLGSTGRIEVLRGPASSLYGTAAGGVIHIHTEEPPPEPFVEQRLAVGEHGFLNGQLKSGGRMGRFRYLANLSYFELDGYRDHARTRAARLNARLGYTIDQNSDVSLVLAAVDSPVADDPGGLTRHERRAQRRQASPRNRLFDAGEEVEQQRLGVVYRRSFGHAHELDARSYLVRRDFANLLPFEAGGAVELDRWFGGGGLRYLNTTQPWGHRNRLILGFDADAQRDQRKQFDNRLGRRGAKSLDQDEDVTSFGLYLHDQLELGWHLSASAGVRYDWVEFEVDGSGDLDFEAFSPEVALLWSPLEALHAYGRISTSFETPTTTELANPSGQGGFNSSLEAQTATNYEVGVKGLLPGRLRYGLALFRIDLQDELVPFEVAGMPGRSFFRNAGRSARQGLEFDLAVEPVPGVTASLAYTHSHFTFERFETPQGNFGGNRLPGIPRHQLYGELAYHHPSGFYAAWEAFYAGAVYADDANRVRSGAYLVSSLRLGHRIRFGSWELAPFLGVNNLFDRRYDANVRLNAVGGRFFEPAPDRSVYGGLGVRYDFGGS